MLVLRAVSRETRGRVHLRARAFGKSGPVESVEFVYIQVHLLVAVGVGVSGNVLFSLKNSTCVEIFHHGHCFLRL
jgi:hypothetical protein